MQLFNQSYAAEIVFLCKKVDLINPKGNFGIVPDRFSAQIKLNPVGIFNKYKSTVVFGSKKYFINVNATDHEYIGVSSESNDDSVNHLIISRSSGESWLGFANMNKGYSYVMYAKCVKRQF
jgi:hypothetical protein